MCSTPNLVVPALILPFQALIFPTVSSRKPVLTSLPMQLSLLSSLVSQL